MLAAFYDEDQEVTVRPVGEYVAICIPDDGELYIDFIMVKLGGDGKPFCDTWAEGGLSLAQARQVAEELATAIRYLEGMTT